MSDIGITFPTLLTVNSVIKINSKWVRDKIKIVRPMLSIYHTLKCFVTYESISASLTSCFDSLNGEFAMHRGVY